MAYYLNNASSSSAAVNIPSITIGANVGDYIELKAVANAGNPSGNYRVMGKQSGFSDFIEISSGGIRFAASNASILFSSGYAQPAIGSIFTVRVTRATSTTWRCELNGTTLGSPLVRDANATFDAIGRFSNSGSEAFRGGFYYVAISNNGGVSATRYYDPSASGGTGTVLPDTASAQNGTQVGTWPANDAEWVFYSDGGAVTASVTYDIGGFGFAISANEIDPAITAAVDYDIGGLSFEVSSTVTTPGVTTSLNYDIGSIGFAASATVGVNASGAYDIGSVGFDVSASAATNNAVASVAYDVGSIGFAVNSSVSSVNTTSANYDIGSINFAVSSILVTNASGAVNYDIGGVTYSINANAPLNEPERSLSGKDNPFWRKSIFFNTQRRY